MLFRKEHLQGIKSGAINLAFRKWKKPMVKRGTLLKTAVGQVEILAIAKVNEKSLTEKDAKKAGFKSKQELLKSFYRASKGTIYKIGVAYYSEDPRIELREQTELTDEQFSELKKKLQRFDKYSRQGNWTEGVLIAIKGNPNQHAIKIAEITGFEKEWLKRNIRKLKNLGLTLSHRVGYEISPFGQVFLERLLNEQRVH